MAKPPNILFIMADQLAASALPAYGHPLVIAPHMTALAEGGVVFDAAYCNFPICAPSRFSLLSGLLASRIAAYDNAAEFAAATPTIAHYLRIAGYRTVVGGLAEDTIIVLTSDHGDMLGERGLWYNTNGHYD